MSKKPTYKSPDRICRFRMADGSVRRMRARHVPHFFGELHSDEDKPLSEGAITLRDCVAHEPGFEGLFKLHMMLTDDEPEEKD